MDGPMTGQGAFAFTAALIAGLTLVALLLVAVLQINDFRGLPRKAWLRAWRGAAIGLALGLAAMAAIGLALPGAPLLDASHDAGDLTVVAAIFSGLGMMMLAATAFNLALYRAAGRLDARQTRWTCAAIAGIYVIVVGGFGWAVLA